MKKRILAVLLLTLAALPCGQAGEKAFVLKFSSISVPGDAHTDAMQVFADEVKKITGGNITVDVFHSASLVGAEGEMDAAISGEVDMIYVSPQLAANYIDYFAMLTSGYFFKNYEHLRDTFNGDNAVNARLSKDMSEQIGLVPIASVYIGARQINTTKKPIHSRDDMAGLLLRMPNTPTWLYLGKALGANPTPMSFNEIYTALSTGAVDGQDNPMPTMQTAKFYEVAPYLAITNHLLANNIMTVNKEVWESMSDSQKSAMRSAAKVAQEWCDKTNLDKEAGLVEFFQQNKVTVTYPDIDKFSKEVQDYYLNDPQQAASWDMDLYKEIQALAK
ncbi:MAG: DctP family TRAP transporter solute-binding subunit [Planctomycetaceae bacterium]|nr:DctP family TRAP transporter solute-binding subunit [Planctomycetaceae bacterium]